MSNKTLESIISERENKPEGLKFPCHHPVKAMGPNTEKFRKEVLFMVQKHSEKTSESDISTNVSKTGKYQSVTVDLTADSREQLQSIYTELKQHKDVKWTL